MGYLLDGMGWDGTGRDVRSHLLQFPHVCVSVARLDGELVFSPYISTYLLFGLVQSRNCIFFRRLVLENTTLVLHHGIIIAASLLMLH
jgi:hypothetical protein